LFRRPGEKKKSFARESAKKRVICTGKFESEKAILLNKKIKERKALQIGGETGMSASMSK